MAACARLHIVASRLHVPEKRLTQCDGCGFISQYPIHAKHRRNWNTGERRHWPKRKNNLAPCISTLRANMAVISKRHYDCQNPYENSKKSQGPGRRFHLFSPAKNVAAQRCSCLDPAINELLRWRVSTWAQLVEPEDVSFAVPRARQSHGGT